MVSGKLLNKATWIGVSTLTNRCPGCPLSSTDVALNHPRNPSGEVDTGPDEKAPETGRSYPNPIGLITEQLLQFACPAGCTYLVREIQP